MGINGGIKVRFLEWNSPKTFFPGPVRVSTSSSFSSSLGVPVRSSAAVSASSLRLAAAASPFKKPNIYIKMFVNHINSSSKLVY